MSYRFRMNQLPSRTIGTQEALMIAFMLSLSHQIETHTRPKISHILHLYEMKHKLSNVNQIYTFAAYLRGPQHSIRLYLGVLEWK